MRERLGATSSSDGPLEVWNTPGAEYTGWIAGFKPGKMFGQGRSRLLVLDLEDGSRKTTSIPHVLDNIIQEEGLAVGSYVEIKYVGKRISKAGKPFHHFEVFGDRDKNRAGGPTLAPAVNVPAVDNVELEGLKARFLATSGEQGPTLLGMLERTSSPGELADTLRKVLAGK